MSSTNQHSTRDDHDDAPALRSPARAIINVLFLAAAVTAALIDALFPVTLALATAAAGVIVWTIVSQPTRNEASSTRASSDDQPNDQPEDPSRQAPDPWTAQAHAAAVIDAFDTPTLVISPAGYVLLANSSASQLLSPSRPILGRPLEEIFTKAEILDLIASARRGVARTAHVRLPTPNGTRVLDVLASPIPEDLTPRDPEGTVIEPTATERPRKDRGVIVAVRDVTDLSLALQLKTDFVANASHELRTPISAIRAAVDTLEVAGEDEAMRARLLDMVNRHTTRLDELVRDMLDLSKLESPDAPIRIRSFAASEIAQELSEGLARACDNRELTLRFDLPGEFEHMKTDRRILMLILKNLVENATKFAEVGTEVLVRGTVLRDHDGEDSPRCGARFEVIDRGEGIPLAQQQRIFERFFQVDESRTGQPQSRGTGLGLAIVKHGVNALEGSVAVKSVWQKGTTITVDLPDVLESPQPAPPKTETQPAPG